MRTASSIGLLLIALALLALPVASQAQVSVGISIGEEPPPLPVYVQPPVPEPGYIWTPGYWAYGEDGYYWVPGTWVEPPSVGLLWTPGYWGWRNGFYVWNGGYWGPHVGFYGGINYGFGYTGVGFVGGGWRGGVFSYNRAVTNVNTTIIHNTYNTTVINNTTVVNHTSFNGGTGGIQARPTAGESLAMREHHIEPTRVQNEHFHAASTNRSLLASENHGHPNVAASSRPGVFSGQGVVAARNANINRNAVNNTSFKSGNNTAHSANNASFNNGTNNLSRNNRTNNLSRNNNVPQNSGSFRSDAYGSGGGAGRVYPNRNQGSFNNPSNVRAGSFNNPSNVRANTAVRTQSYNGGQHGSNSRNNNNNGNSRSNDGRRH